jgi:hypothetical protein
LAAAASLLVVAMLLISQLEQLPVSPQAFGLAVAFLLDLAALGVLLYWSVATVRLSYRVTRNGVVITWGASRLQVPVERIQAVLPFNDFDGRTQLGAVRRPWWLGGGTGQARLADGREVYLRTSLPLAQSLVILTGQSVYVVSPQRPESFVQTWQARRPLGPTQYWPEQERRTWLLGLPIWNDQVAWGLVAGALGAALALNGYLAFIYDRLPAVLSLHFDVLGQPDRIGGRAELLRLPVLAAVLLALDLTLGFAVYRRERVAAYLVWGGGIILQLLAWGALVTIRG